MAMGGEGMSGVEVGEGGIYTGLGVMTDRSFLGLQVRTRLTGGEGSVGGGGVGNRRGGGECLVVGPGGGARSRRLAGEGDRVGSGCRGGVNNSVAEWLL